MAIDVEAMLEADGATLPVAYCLKCHKEVIVHGRLGEGARAGQLIWCCLFCDEEVMMEEGGVRYHAPVELKELGYTLVDPGELATTGGGGAASGGRVPFVVKPHLAGAGGPDCHPAERGPYPLPVSVSYDR
jgi:hypothetical protein